VVSAFKFKSVRLGLLPYDRWSHIDSTRKVPANGVKGKEMKRICVIGVLSLALVGIVTSSRADFVSGFETPDISGTTIAAYGPGVTPMTTTGAADPWTVLLGDVEQIHEAYLGLGLLDAEGGAGDQYLDINGSVPGTIYTTFDVTPSTPYDLSFQYTDHPGRDPLAGDAAVLVSVLLPDLTTLVIPAFLITKSVNGAPLDWVLHSPGGSEFTSPAVGTELVLMFSGAPGALDPDAGMLLDAVSVTAVPEARAWLAGAMICGMMGLVYAFRTHLNRRKAMAAA
jgi:hypothetical protein